MKTRKDVLRPIKSLIRNQCASFQNGNECRVCPGDQTICSFFRSDGKYPDYLKSGAVRCSYFETHVLPADPALELAYWGKHPEGQHGKSVGNCSRCKASFIKQSNRHVFCKECQEQTTKLKARDRQRKKYWEDKTQNLTV